jgi:hypothetical protein
MGVGLFVAERRRRCPLGLGRPSVCGLIPPLFLIRPVVGNCARNGGLPGMVRRMAVIKEEKFHPSGSEQNLSSTTRVGEKQGEACFYVQPAEVFSKS